MLVKKHTEYPKIIKVQLYFFKVRKSSKLKNEQKIIFGNLISQKIFLNSKIYSLFHYFCKIFKGGICMRDILGERDDCGVEK